MLEIDGNYIEFIKMEHGRNKEMYFNGIPTGAESRAGDYESTEFMCNAEEFCKVYIAGERDTFNSTITRPKSKYIDYKIKQLIASVLPHLLID